MILCSAASAVFAQEVTQSISYRDLDLATPNGQKLLAKRIHRAVRSVCGSADVRDLDATRDLSNCKRIAYQAASRNVEAMAARKGTGDRAYSSLDESALPHTPAK
ncbi:UrcA family protein [Flavisphingomonas formosensis]|uniref:UrcA family protein n=1 Tax=Flavisphingomonas formosensis TaxID=861534 RepID=UPI001E44BC3C|nr:UrcA family protein [Sphingomonas formosensis]